MNHSENFVDPNTGAHTQKLEGVWGHIMNFLGNHKKPTNKLYESHMAEQWWRRLHGNSQEIKSINISENFYVFFFILILFCKNFNMFIFNSIKFKILIAICLL